MIPNADKSLQQCFDKIAKKVGTITKPYRGKLGNVYTALFVHNPLITLKKIYKSSNHKTFKVKIHKITIKMHKISTKYIFSGIFTKFSDRKRGQQLRI